MNVKLKRSLSIFLSVCLFLVSVTVAFAQGDYDGKIIILHTNDIHGAIDKYAYISGIKKDFESKGAEVILADAGDFMQGTSYVNVEKGANAVSLMNSVGYNVTTVGNHEFDYGYENLLQQTANAKFSVICSNVYKGNDLLLNANYTYTSSNGTKIGFFGLNTPETQTKANLSMIKGLTFKSGEALYKIAQQQVNALAGADVIICLCHLGIDSSSSPNRSLDVYNRVDGIDFMIDGHSHTVMTKGVLGEKIQSAGKGGEKAGVIVVDEKTKTIEDNYLISIDENTPCDSSVKTLADGYIEKIKKEYAKVMFLSAKVMLTLYPILLIIKQII